MNTKQTLLVLAFSSVLVACGSGSNGGGVEITKPTVHHTGGTTIKEFPTAANGKKLFVLKNAHVVSEKGKYLVDEVEKSTYDGKRLHILGQYIDLSKEVKLQPGQQQGLQLENSDGTNNQPGESSKYARLGNFANFARNNCGNGAWRFSSQRNDDICTQEGFIDYIEGEVTPVDELPTGMATYSSETGRATVDFANKQLTGTFVGGIDSSNEYDFNAKIFANTFRSTRPHVTSEYTSSVVGGFFGPQAADMAGHILVLENERDSDFSYGFVLHKE